MSSLHAREVEHSSLPIISIAGLRSSDERDRAAVAREIRAACTDTGFFYIRDHGIAADLCAAVIAESRRFFAQPLEAKMRLDMAKSTCNRGYSPVSQQLLEPGTPPDLKESFQLARDLPADDPRVVAGSQVHGPNLWPENLPGWRDPLEAYQIAMEELCATIMTGIALSLDLPEDAFAGYCDDPVGTIRLLHYPPQPANPKPGEKGAGAHTDWGGVTILLQDDAGGLQVRDESGGWIHAAPIPDTFVVNLGDMMARWTNDRYRSTTHRVVNASGRDRLSVAFFYDGRYDYVISCIPTCLGPDESPKYPVTTPSEHLAMMYRLTYPA